MQQYPVPGAPPQAGGYGTPPAPAGYNGAQQAPAAPSIMPGMNPFKGMKRGGDKTPISEFVGGLTSVGIGSGGFGGSASIDLHFDRVQVLHSDAPYPYTTVDLSIKYSDSVNSGWGVFAQSVADALGIELEMVEPSSLVNNSFHIVRMDDYLFFTRTNVNPPEEIRGTAWRMVAIVQPGAQVTPVSQQAAPAATQPPVAAPVADPIAAAQAAMAVAATPAAPQEVLQTAPNPNQSPEERALEILDGNDMATFFQQALPDSKVREDPNLINLIFNNTFIQAMIAKGSVVVNEDGTHTVPALH
jgi:hypothetical protein